MYHLIELHDGTSVPVRAEDLTRLEKVLEKISLTGQEKITDGTSIYRTSMKMGIASVQLVAEAELPITMPIGFCDDQVHPIRSLGYYGLGDFYAGIESSREEQNATFRITRDYFKDLFLLQEAILLEETQSNPDRAYLSPLQDAFERMRVEYPTHITKQTDAFEELARWLSSPSRN